MGSHSAKLTSKGQITLPAALRAELGLKPGDRVDFRRTERGNFELVAKRLRLEDLHGILRVDGPTPSADEIVEAVDRARTLKAQEIADRFHARKRT